MSEALRKRPNPQGDSAPSRVAIADVGASLLPVPETSPPRRRRSCLSLLYVVPIVPSERKPTTGCAGLWPTIFFSIQFHFAFPFLLSVHPSVNPSIHPSIRPSIHPSSIPSHALPTTLSSRCRFLVTAALVYSSSSWWPEERRRSLKRGIATVTASLGLPHDTLRLFSGMAIITVASHQKVSVSQCHRWFIIKFAVSGQVRRAEGRDWAASLVGAWKRCDEDQHHANSERPFSYVEGQCGQKV